MNHNLHRLATVALVVCLVSGCEVQNRRASSAVHPATTKDSIGVLVAVTGTRLEVLSPSTGRPLRNRKLAHALPGGPQGQIAVDPSGNTAYVAADPPVTTCGSEVLAIDTSTGAEKVVATSASAPAVNPTGTMLAYVNWSGSSTPGLGCTSTSVTVENLTSRVRRSWRITKPTPAGRAAQILETLNWLPRGPELIVGSVFGPFTGIQILDTGRPLNSANPLTVGAAIASRGLPGGRYSDPVDEIDGSIVALAPSCWGAMGCAARDDFTAIVTVAAGTGKATVIASRDGEALVGLVVGLPSKEASWSRKRRTGVSSTSTASRTTGSYCFR
jgi:hypothetical protein